MRQRHKSHSSPTTWPRPPAESEEPQLSPRGRSQAVWVRPNILQIMNIYTSLDPNHLAATPQQEMRCLTPSQGAQSAGLSYTEHLTANEYVYSKPTNLGPQQEVLKVPHICLGRERLVCAARLHKWNIMINTEYHIQKYNAEYKNVNSWMYVHVKSLEHKVICLAVLIWLL